MKLVVPLLAAVVIFAVGFVLVELHAPLSPATTTPPPPVVEPPAATRPPIAPGRPLPPGAVAERHRRPSRPPPSRAAPEPAPAAEPPPPPPAEPPPVPPANDPLDVVVRGKTRREWHAYYAERQEQLAADMQRYQAVIDRAIAGEEPDPRELGEAHDKVREINAHLKEDLEALQQIDGTP